MKTNKEFATETVKVVMGLISLMRPTSKTELDMAMEMAAMLVETSVDQHMEQHLNAAHDAARAATEGK